MMFVLAEALLLTALGLFVAIPAVIAFNVFSKKINHFEGELELMRDTLDAYWEANMDLASVTPKFDLYDPDWPFRTYQGQFPPAKSVYDNVSGGRVGAALDSLVCGGVIISGGRVIRSILSPGVRIHSYAEVVESVILDRVDVGRRARIRKAIIDKDVKIPRGMEIGYDLEEDSKRFTITDGGVVVVPSGIVL
jgi:glucose-1-phosphate adenylyltransferase